MTVTIGRRELLAALGGAAAAWPNPTTGTPDCCARAASGHVAAALPKMLMKSRRLM
jgi:hypothetical protein